MLRLKEQLAHQWCLLLIAISFFTRLKIPPIKDFQQSWLNQANRYYGLVGILIGSISALVLLLASQFLPLSISIILSMICSVLVTGAFHEDGFADTWDGFGGGWTIDNKLSIMKDSRLGTYGALALVFAILIKYQLLIEISNIDSATTYQIIIAIIIAHTASRAMAVSIIFDQPYVRDNESSKIKPMTEQQSIVELIILLATSALPLLLIEFKLACLLIGLLLLLRYFLIRWYHQQIGGYTGDLLGAAQQIAEICCYTVLLAYWL